MQVYTIAAQRPKGIDIKSSITYHFMKFTVGGRFTPVISGKSSESWRPDRTKRGIYGKFSYNMVQ